MSDSEMEPKEEEKQQAAFRNQLCKTSGLMEVRPDGKLIEWADTNSNIYTTVEGACIEFSGVEFEGTATRIQNL
jgi:hypothetical protein